MLHVSLDVRDALIDGEVVMLLPDGRTSFQALQNASSGKASRDSLVYFVFDVLRLDDERLARMPLEERKERLRALIGVRNRGRIRYADHVIGQGAAISRAGVQRRTRGDRVQAPRPAATRLDDTGAG